MNLRLPILAAFVFALGNAWAHLTPPVVLVSERDAVASQHQGAKKLSLREASLTADERKAVQSAHGWRATDDVHNFYMGRDDAGKLLSGSSFEAPAAGGGGADAMAQHYDSIVSRMVQRAVILYNVLVTKRGVT
jgi:hypothetical protein